MKALMMCMFIALNILWGKIKSIALSETLRREL